MGLLDVWKKRQLLCHGWRRLKSLQWRACNKLKSLFLSTSLFAFINQKLSANFLPVSLGLLFLQSMQQLKKIILIQMHVLHSVMYADLYVSLRLY